jgi:predicted permease
MLRVLLSRLKGLRGRRSDAELNEDIEAHLDLLARDYIDRGLPPDEARAAARRAFGGVAQMQEIYRDQRGLPFVDGLLQDVRYGARMIRRNPGFAAVAILSIALGIAASTAGFSVFNAVMLRPLAVAEPDRLVLLQPRDKGGRGVIFNPTYEQLSERQRTLTGMFAVNDEPYRKVTFGDSPVPSYVRASQVSGSYFHVLGVSPLLGRLLVPDDDVVTADGRCAAVIGYRFWVHRFQQAPDVVGRTFGVRSTTCTIVGVAPESFEGHQSGFVTDVWLPLRPMTDPNLLASRSMAFFAGVMGRLAPGVDRTQAERDLTGIFQQVQAGEPPPRANQPPTSPADVSLHLASGAQGFDRVRRQFGTPLAIVLGVVGIVLLIACANVANLLLARGNARLPELATRAALGAGRARLVRQLATEGALLAGIGGILGVSLALLTAPVLGSLISEIPIAADVRVIAVAIAATLVTILFTGVLPGMRLSHATLRAGMAHESRTTTGSGQWLTRGLVAAQLALSLLLVSAAGLLLRTMVHIDAIDPGFSPEHVVMLDVRDESPGPSFSAVEGAEQKARRAERYRVLEERLNTLPGIHTASLSWLGLFSSSDLWLPMIDPDRPEDRPLGRIDYVSARYFDTMGMQVLRGRGFSAADREGTLRVAVINEALARARFGSLDPLGRRLALDYRGDEQRPFTIVGLVRDSKYNDLREDRTKPMMWVPLAQAPLPITSIALQTAPGMEAVAARAAGQALETTAPDIMVRKTTTLSAQLARNTARERLLLGLSSGFAVLAVLLAAVGLYGTLAYAVSRRTREIGIRLAFGAERGAVLRMILGEALRLAAVALIAGLPLAIAAGYSLRAFLFGVTPMDPMALAGACAMLLLAALLAAYVPARRASAVDPIVALRWE